MKLIFKDLIAPQSHEILQTFVWGRTCPPTTQISVNFLNFDELYLCSLKMYHFQICQFY